MEMLPILITMERFSGKPKISPVFCNNLSKILLDIMFWNATSNSWKNPACLVRVETISAKFKMMGNCVFIKQIKRLITKELNLNGKTRLINMVMGRLN